MSVSKTELMMLALKLNGIDDVAAKVAVFNAIVPWVKQVRPNFSLVDFYEDVFYRCDYKVKWNGVTQTVLLNDEEGKK